MNKAEAIALANKELESLRGLHYETLRSRIGQAEGFDRVSEKGEPYQVEFDYFFDDKTEENIRVVAMISYSFWTSFAPVSSDFIIARNGRFVGE